MLREYSIIVLLTAIGTAYSLVSGLAPLPWAEPRLEAGEIRLEDAKVLDVIWVDARNELEFADGHAPNAILYDEADTLKSMANVLQRWLEHPGVIIVYCADQGCGRSKYVADELRASMPEAEIYSLKGGWEAWFD